MMKIEPVAKWRPPSLSKLTPMIFNTRLTHLGSEASKSHLRLLVQYPYVVLFYVFRSRLTSQMIIGLEYNFSLKTFPKITKFNFVLCQINGGLQGRVA